MTIAKFQRLLRKVDPRLTLRVRGYGDIIGLFTGHTGRQGYICRMSKGELHLNGYRLMTQDPENTMRLTQGPIVKRGRKTVINLLRNYRWITNHHQRTMLTYGIEYPDDLVRGLNQKRGGSNV